MAKELFISTTPHETKVAVVEDEQLNEIYFERENEYTLAGSIYKGKVTRVLPGMQSAFVDLGLERDAFLYVTDFLEEQEDQEEFDHVAVHPHDNAPRGEAPTHEAPAQDQRPADLDPHHALPPGEPQNFNREQRPDRNRNQRDLVERQPESNAATIGEAGGDAPRPERDGNREDRGNREGGGG